MSIRRSLHMQSSMSSSRKRLDRNDKDEDRSKPKRLKYSMSGEKQRHFDRSKHDVEDSSRNDSGRSQSYNTRNLGRLAARFVKIVTARPYRRRQPYKELTPEGCEVDLFSRETIYELTYALATLESTAKTYGSHQHRFRQTLWRMFRLRVYHPSVKGWHIAAILYYSAYMRYNPSTIEGFLSSVKDLYRLHPIHENPTKACVVNQALTGIQRYFGIPPLKVAPYSILDILRIERTVDRTNSEDVGNFLWVLSTYVCVLRSEHMPQVRWSTTHRDARLVSLSVRGEPRLGLRVDFAKAKNRPKKWGDSVTVGTSLPSSSYHYFLLVIVRDTRARYLIYDPKTLRKRRNSELNVILLGFCRRAGIPYRPSHGLRRGTISEGAKLQLPVYILAGTGRWTASLPEYVDDDMVQPGVLFTDSVF